MTANGNNQIGRETERDGPGGQETRQGFFAACRGVCARALDANVDVVVYGSYSWRTRKCPFALCFELIFSGVGFDAVGAYFLLFYCQWRSAIILVARVVTPRKIKPKRCGMAAGNCITNAQPLALALVLQ